VGYGDAANFDHEFKARFGLTPSEYRSRAGPPSVRETTVENRPSTARAGRHRRVLIVDDDLTTRETLRTSLTAAGYVTEVRATGWEAIDAAIRTRPDVILLDYHLPDMDGLSCLRTLRRRLEEPNQRPPVALFTADWDVEQHSDVVQALGAAYMSKLSDLVEIERVVHSLSEMDTLGGDRPL
jgi:CheY-like chemotaxis protein